MALEEFRCDLIALRKLYGLLLGYEDFLQSSDMDERALLMLKNLLDDATEKVFETHLKIIDTAQSSFSKPSYPSKAEQFEVEQTVLVPSLHKVSPGLSRLSSISSNKLCQIYNESNTKLHNRVEVRGRDGDSQEQPHDELCSIEGTSGHAKGLLDKKQNGIEQYKINQRQKYGNPGVINSVGHRSSSCLVSVDVKPGDNLGAQVENNGDEPEDDFTKDVALAIKRIESGISALEVSSGHSDVLRTGLLTSNSVAKERVLAGSKQIQANQSLYKSRADLASLLMSRVETPQIKKSEASKSTMQEPEIQCQVPGRKVRAMVDRLESLSRTVNQTSQSHEYVQGLRVPPSQNEVVKGPPACLRRMTSRNIKDDAGRNRMADTESTTKSVKSKASMPRKSVGATVSVRPNQMNKVPRREDTVRKWMANAESTTKSVKSKPSLPPKSVRSVVSLRSNQRNKLQHQAILRPTLLDDKTSIPYHNPTHRHERPLPHNHELESSSSDSSYNSQPYSSWTSQQTSTSNGGSEDDLASQTHSSHHFGPASRRSSNVTSDSSSEDSNPSKLGPVKKRGPGVVHRSPDLANQRKATGRLRRLKNKLGLIFHHHHHHHHHYHVKDDDSGHTTSMWKNFQGIFHHNSKPKVHERQAVGKVRNAAAKQHVGQFHTLVDGLWRHTRHSKKSRPSKGRIQGLGNRRMEKKFHWWQKLKRDKGVRLSNRGRAKIKITSRQPQLKLNKMSKHKLSHK